MIKKFPKLYEQSSTGKIKHWEISVAGCLNEAVITVKYGAGDSKVRESSSTITEGKNLGRSNSTSPWEQACLEAEATWKQKQDKGYVKDIAKLQDEVLLPMLAHKFQERKHDIIYPAYVQPKLDGVRCIAKKIDDKTIKYYSRMGKEFTTLEHLTPDLLRVMNVGMIMDGEIYSHDYTFQEAISFIKKLRPQSKDLEYHIFDMINKDDFYSRIREVTKMYQQIDNNSKLKFVETYLVDNEAQVMDKHSEYISDGYEGIMVRNKAGLYALKKRSADLQKYKEFQDEEFEIIGGVSSTGTEVDCIIFNVKNKKGPGFGVRPRGSFEQRKLWLKDVNKLIGKKLTVRFQELSDTGIPRFPVGISVRDYD